MFVNKLEEENRNLIKRQQIKHNNIRDQSKSPINKNRTNLTNLTNITNDPFTNKLMPHKKTNTQMY